MVLQAGNGSTLYETSEDLSTWTEVGRTEGNGSESTQLIDPDAIASLYQARALTTQ